MSTRIDDGCLISGHTLETFLAELKRLQPRFEALANEQAAAWLVRRATELHDRKWLGLRLDLHERVEASDLRGLLSLACEELQERQRDVARLQKRDSEVDFSAEVTLFPLKGRLLAMPFMANRRMLHLWQSQPWWQDHSYWNHTDAPQELEGQAWEQRRSDWKEVFEQHSTPAQAGLSYRLTFEQMWIERASDEVLAGLIPGAHARTKEVALECYLAQTRFDDEPDAQEEEPLSRAMRRLRVVENSDEYAAWKAALENRMPAVNVKQLYAPLADVETAVPPAAG